VQPFAETLPTAALPVLLVIGGLVRTALLALFGCRAGAARGRPGRAAGQPAAVPLGDRRGGARQRRAARWNLRHRVAASALSIACISVSCR
jgi:hypothetical protein